MNDITHREIYDRLVAVEGKVDALGNSTKDVTAAFAAARGAFVVLETLGKLAKPLLWLGGLLAAVVTFWDIFRNR
jgi:cytochrome c-type biogenesis protein CcmH/NrfF